MGVQLSIPKDIKVFQRESILFPGGGGGGVGQLLIPMETYTTCDFQGGSELHVPLWGHPCFHTLFLQPVVYFQEHFFAFGFEFQAA